MEAEIWSPAMRRRAATRLAVVGWVEKRLSAPRPLSGLEMYIWAMAGLRSA